MREQTKTGGLMLLPNLCEQVQKLRGGKSSPITPF